VGAKGQLFVVDRTTERAFRAPPKYVAAERDFNRIEVEGMDRDAVERALAEFEGKVAPALERLKAAKSLALGSATRRPCVRIGAPDPVPDHVRRRQLAPVDVVQPSD
jgi:hypothetical protein